MQNKPEDAFRCGPFALDRILAFQNSNYKLEEPILQSRSTVHGMSLTEVWKLSETLHMNMQMAVRSKDVQFLLPSVVHWRAGHYAALLKEENGHYLVQDPTFGDEFWVSRAALNQEASGFFLVPAGPLPESWQTIDLSSDPLKITRVTDPFGRFATFDYTSTGRLMRITDVIGIQSSFGYGPTDFISTLTTPYGTTTFTYGEPDGTTRWLEATDP